MNKQEINIETWERKAHYELFSKMDYPHFSICVDLDVTALVRYAKENKWSFFKTMVYCVSKVANEFEPFRLRIQGDKVYLYEAVNPSFTYLLSGNLYSYISIAYQKDFTAFLASIDQYIEAHQGQVDVEDRVDVNELLFMTSIPWLKFNDIQHPIHMKPTDSIPRICWGKYEEDFKGRLMMPVSVQVNHALMDGFHVSQYLLKLEALLKAPEGILAAQASHPIATLYMASGNEIRIELFPEVAPNAVNSVIALAQKGCYDNREVRRIVKDFVIQPSYNAFESDPECDYMIDGEFKANGFENPLPLSKYAVAMAGDGSQQASGSEFFIVVGDCEERLEGKFTGIGRVIFGFEELERLLSVETMPVSVEGLEVTINEPKTPEIISQVVIDTFGKTYEAPIKLI